ncbi:nitroreductase/quinone reductase family protein, partial [Streptomyces sp. NPDC056222]|uniref:nitroreductase/quinone reductase family protein n=1 Tax=Streptomyces sp. NPDC056222 TaxID=3345749 RepID=UPI0035E139A2
METWRQEDCRDGLPLHSWVLLLLTTTGARSGKKHTAPFGFARDDDRDREGACGLRVSEGLGVSGSCGLLARPPSFRVWRPEAVRQGRSLRSRRCAMGFAHP